MRLALLLALLPSALAQWPQPSSQTTGGGLVRIAPDVRVSLVNGTDSARVPMDLSTALSDAQKALSAGVPALIPDRGESLRGALAHAPVLRDVQVTVTQLLSQHPNECFTAAPSPLLPRAFDDHGPQVSLEWPHDHLHVTGGPDKFAHPASANKCSVSTWATRPLRTDAAREVRIDDTKAVPTDLAPRDAEAYELTVPGDGKAASVRAHTALGALRALQTLTQLVHSLSNDTYIASAPVHILDRPAFAYRGLLLDTARHFFPLPDLERTLRAMASVKLNTFHWHATDAQSWPLAFDAAGAGANESSAIGFDLPSIAARGAVKGETYSEADVRSVVDYAAARGINVVLELDMPAHLMAGLAGAPKPAGTDDLITCADADNWEAVAAEPPSGQLNLRPGGKGAGVPPRIAALVRALLARAASLTRGPVLSSGGDEPNLACWNATAATVDTETMAPFAALVRSSLDAANRTQLVWQEMAIDFPAAAKVLAPGTIVAAWNGPDAPKRVLDASQDTLVVHADSGHFYLDCGFGEWLGGTTAQSWCPFVSWQQSYAFDPYNNTAEDRRARILGGEAALWTEAVDQHNLDQRLWPRAAAAAEVFWTGNTFKLNNTDVVRQNSSLTALPRILDLRERLVKDGVHAEPLQPTWCITRPGRCNLAPPKP